jgi:2-oxoglutarate ferredoxin oxidoreductase subunit gamma
MKEIIFGGFGGQGVLTSGMVLTYIVASYGLSPVWMPSYGATMRGGMANCVVKYGENDRERVGSPAMENADILVSMNEPSLGFMQFCKPSATIFVNTSSVRKDYPFVEGVNYVKIDCNSIASAAGSPRGANLVMLGAVLGYSKLFDEEFSVESMCQYFSGKGKSVHNEANERALRAGFAVIK